MKGKRGKVEGKESVAKEEEQQEMERLMKRRREDGEWAPKFLNVARRIRHSSSLIGT